MDTYVDTAPEVFGFVVHVGTCRIWQNYLGYRPCAPSVINVPSVHRRAARKTIFWFSINTRVVTTLTESRDSCRDQREKFWRGLYYYTKYSTIYRTAAISSLRTYMYMWTNIFKGTVLWKQGPLQKFVRPYRFNSINGTYSNLHRDRDPTSVVLNISTGVTRANWGGTNLPRCTGA